MRYRLRTLLIVPGAGAGSPPVTVRTISSDSEPPVMVKPLDEIANDASA